MTPSKACSKLQSSLIIFCVTYFYLGDQTFAQDRGIYFSSPSKNIFCVFYPEQLSDSRYRTPYVDAYIRCDILQFNPTLKNVPRQSQEDINIFGRCTVSQMKAFIIEDQAMYAKSYCPTDVPAPEQFVLEYGKNFSRGGLMCNSQMNGMTCQNSQGHGFFLSRNLQKLF